MGSGINRPVLDPKHPVLRQEYAIYTPPMDEMINTIGDWIDQRVSGGYIYGPSRFGKSRGIKWFIRSVLEERFGARLPMVVWIRPHASMRSEGEFWNLLLEASNFRFCTPLKPKKKLEARFLFKQQLITLTRLARQNYVVLIIDEGHDVTLSEWKWLLGLQNEMDYDGFRLSIFSIGSHQIGFQPNYMARTGNPHIAARFFAVDARFHGIRSLEDLTYVLNGYDVDSDWPSGSNTSYLKYFAPDEFAKNNRLQNCAGDMWKAFSALLPKVIQVKEKKYPLEIPMQHVAFTLEDALRKLAKGDEWSNVTSYDNWLEMIAKTGVTDHLRMISVPA